MTKDKTATGTVKGVIRKYNDQSFEFTPFVIPGPAGRRLHLRNVELVVVLEDLANGVDLEELRGSAGTDIAAEVGYLVFKVDIPLLTQHADGGEEEALGADMLFLENGNDAVREVQQALQLIVIADGKHGMGPAEGGQ